MVFQKQGHQIIFESPARLTIISLLSISHSLALHTNIKRYMTGIDVFGWNLNLNVEWWDWPQIAPMTVWGIASLSFVFMSYILVEHISTQSNKSSLYIS